MERRVVIVGAGAAGFFAAIACAEKSPQTEVLLLEATAHPLAKVRISGGGRCNVTHACFVPAELVKSYPRGARELRGPFHRWQPRDTVAWFEQRGVSLKTEEDGRMFPTTDNSATIVTCLQDAAAAAGVKLRLRCGLADAALRPGGGFVLQLTPAETLECDALLLATGGNRSSAGFTIAQRLGHEVEPLVPSLFTFQIDDARLKDLSGVSVPASRTSIVGSELKASGPLLVTHWGLSGPGILKLSAWGARDLAARDYRFTVRVNWTDGLAPETAKEMLGSARTAHPRRQVSTWNPFGLPNRLWDRLVEAAEIPSATPWTSLSNQKLSALAGQVVAADFAVTGKSMNKDEFVTCGGVRLDQVQFKTMESRLVPGLYFAGEILDIDGITGGFNFQAAWTTGMIAGSALAGFAL